MTARYDAVADFYTAGFDDARDPVVTALLEMLGPVSGKQVLDVACGHGRVSRELARRGATVTGVDISQALLGRAAPDGVRYVHADIAAAETLDDVAFDAAVCSFGLSDIDDLDGALQTVHRTLRPGGTFAFSILHPCFPGGGEVSGAWPSGARYFDEGFWRADGEASALRRQVGANHRMLSTYLNALTRSGLHLTETAEPEPPAGWSPEVARFPVFLMARCLKSLDGDECER